MTYIDIGTCLHPPFGLCSQQNMCRKPGPLFIFLFPEHYLFLFECFRRMFKMHKASRMKISIIRANLLFTLMRAVLNYTRIHGIIDTWI